jgi:hypothetical protein
MNQINQINKTNQINPSRQSRVQILMTDTTENSQEAAVCLPQR